MAEYENPVAPRSVTARPRLVTLHPGFTALDLASRYHQGAFAFGAVLAHNGRIDGLPFDGPPPRHLRRMSVQTGERLAIPDGGL